jgi:tRNA-dihydrouridine synthase A
LRGWHREEGGYATGADFSVNGGLHMGCHLRFNAEEHPVALQLGGSEPADLAHCARLGEQWGYDEINLNCGCPSERVQRGAFGACLMAEPALVADCVKAMVDVVDVPVTVKHRIGIDHTEDTPESYPFVRDFVGRWPMPGARCSSCMRAMPGSRACRPRKTATVPPLRYDLVHRLKTDFPHLTIAINGGITTSAQVAEQLQQVDGVMVGREAYHNPWWLASGTALYYGAVESHEAPSRERWSRHVRLHGARSREHGTPWSSIARHMLGLRHGLPGARRWRQVWSDHRLKACHRTR